MCERVLHGNRSIKVTFVAFDVLRVDGHDVMRNPWAARRALLDELGLERSCVRPSEVFDDGAVLFDAVVEHGLEGVVAKRRNGVYRPGYRGWTKIKNPATGGGSQSKRRCSGSGIAPPRSATATSPTAEATSNQCSRE